MTEKQRAASERIYALFDQILRLAVSEQPDLVAALADAGQAGLFLEQAEIRLTLFTVTKGPSAHSDHDFLKSLRIAPDLEPHTEDAPPGGEPR